MAVIIDRQVSFDGIILSFGEEATTFAVQFSGVEVDYVTRIRANGVDIYNLDTPTSLNDDITFEIFTGRAGQPQSAIIQEIVGVGSSPDFDGIAYIVFKDFDFTSFGGSRPTFTIDFTIGGAPTSTQVTVPLTLSQSVDQMGVAGTTLIGTAGDGIYSVDTLTKTLNLERDLVVAADALYTSSSIVSPPSLDVTNDLFYFTGGSANSDKIYEADLSTLVLQSSFLTAAPGRLSQVLNDSIATGTTVFNSNRLFSTSPLASVATKSTTGFGNNYDMIALSDATGPIEVYGIHNSSILSRMFDISTTPTMESFDLSASLDGINFYITYDSFTKSLIIGNQSKIIKWDPATQAITGSVTISFSVRAESSFQQGPYNGKLYISQTSTSVLELDTFNMTTRTISGLDINSNARVYDPINHGVWTVGGGARFQPLDRFTGGSATVDGSTTVIWP